MRHDPRPHHTPPRRQPVLDLRDTDPVTTVHRGIITAGHLREGDRLAWGESHRVWRVTRTTLIETVTA